ncbi:hypothetical protein BLJAPNOD_04562 [Ensifer sp. M14]|uniref:hypothetical protein n=1 Tax=Sinorhizobium/Ensifer group TaxID=227292 RepID=UPI000986F915|nr:MULTISPECIES: hypothetical protein [Sinorhizobium/Ensifer group]OOG70338.1 hypothetical protein B0E45_14300 [Sinorhizobium sp. A49]RDL48287.1 hypothetical protein BLJAPNOD_04562 [Ensifer sp. M14]
MRSLDKISRDRRVVAFLSAGIAATVLTLLSTELAASDDKLSGLPSLVLGGQTATAQTFQFETPFNNLINAGSLAITLEKTTLDEVKATFGGNIRSRTVEGLSVGWLCYELSTGDLPRRIWFVANGRSDATTPAQKPVTFISTEEVSGDADKCDTPTVALAPLLLPVPTLKDSAADLEKRFGAAPMQEMVRYAHQQQGEQNMMVLQSLVYRLKNGHIDGIAFTQVTTK